MSRDIVMYSSFSITLYVRGIRSLDEGVQIRAKMAVL
jgi:hypothetical protein